MRTFEYRLYPTREQHERLRQCLIETRQAYNAMLDYAHAQWQPQTQKPPAPSFVPLSRSMLCRSRHPIPSGSIERKRQAQRIREHKVLGRGFVTLLVDTSGGSQETQCLRLDLIPLWPAGVNAKRVSLEVHTKLYSSATSVWSKMRRNHPARSYTLVSSRATTI